MTTLSKAEISYIRSSLLSDPPLRADGRSPEDFRLIALETGVAPLANGSARVSIGRAGPGRDRETEGGTEVVAAVKLEVDGLGEGQEGGNVICSVSWYVLQSIVCLHDIEMPQFPGSVSLALVARTRRSPVGSQLPARECALPSVASPNKPGDRAWEDSVGAAPRRDRVFGRRQRCRLSAAGVPRRTVGHARATHERRAVPRFGNTESTGP